MKSVAARLARRMYFTGAVPGSPHPQQLLGGGEAGEHGSFHLRGGVGVAAEDQGRRALDVDELLVVRVHRLAVLPAVDGGGLYARLYVVLSFFKEKCGDRVVIFLHLFAAPLGTGVDGDSGSFGNALLPVVGDPE